MIGNKKLAQVGLLSALLIIVPMLYFPAKFGMDLATGSFTYSMFEIVFYGFVFYFFRPGSSLLQLVAGSGLTFLYRIVLGTISGVLLSIFYSMDFSVSLALGVSRYLPAIILHILAAPFVMRPFFLGIAEQSENASQSRTRMRRPPQPERQKEVGAQPYFPRSGNRPATGAAETTNTTKGGISMVGDGDGFQRAVRYLGEHQAVLLATAVDAEGLTLAVFQRGDSDPSQWAPYSLIFQQANEVLLRRNRDENNVDRLDLVFGPSRLVIVKIENYSLLVLCRHEDDELLGIRITQAADIIRKYTSERYGHLMPSVTEERYVSNT